MRPYAAVAVFLALAACSSGSPSPAAVQTSAATTPPATTAAPAPVATTATATASASPRTDLADGRHEAYLTALDVSKKVVTVDVVQFLTGAAAEQAAKEDGQDEVPNDYYVRNQNKRLRTLDLAPSLTIVVNVLSAEETGDATKDTPITLAKLKSFFTGGSAQSALFHVTIAGGIVTRLDEQYLP